MEVTDKTLYIVSVHLITNRIGCLFFFFFLFFCIKLWPLSGIQIARSFASIPFLPSNEIMVQQVREFIKTLKDKLIKDLCVQS